MSNGTEAGKSSTDDVFYPAIVASSFDALGLSTLLSSEEDALGAVNTCEGLIGQILDARRAYEEPDRNSDFIGMFEHSMYFGDSVYVLSDPSLSLHVQVVRLTALAAGILWCGIYSTVSGRRKAFAPRIGIAQGNLRIRTISAGGQAHELQMGTSMATAYEIERNQRWVGGALAAELRQKDDPYCVEYGIPMKTKYDGPQLCAINWLPIAFQNAHIYSPEKLLNDLAAHTGKQVAPDAQEKWKNTHTFAVTMLEQLEG